MIKIFSDLELEKARPLGVNMYPGDCVDCGEKVWFKKGFIYRNFDPKVKRKFDIRCIACANIYLNKRRG